MQATRSAPIATNDAVVDAALSPEDGATVE
jgi:hypothetical protein